jgi:hypothetical protein
MGHDPGPVQSNSHPHIFLTRSIFISCHFTVRLNCVCNCHSRGFPHQQYATLFHFILTSQTEIATVYLYQYALINTHSLLQLTSNTMHYLFQEIDSNQENISMSDAPPTLDPAIYPPADPKLLVKVPIRMSTSFGSQP